MTRTKLTRIETHLEDGKAVISVYGPIDARALGAEIDGLVKSGVRQIGLDLLGVNGLDGLDSTTVGELVALWTWVENCGAEVSLVNLPRKLKEILDNANLSDWFK